MRNTLIFVLALATTVFVGCTTEVKKPEKQWAVRVTDAQLVGNNAYVPEGKDETKERAAAPESQEGKLWVWHADGSKQCEKTKKGIDPERLANAVQVRGISVFQYRNSHDDKMHPMICGSPTGKTVELEIRALDLPKAKKLGLLEKNTGN